MNANRFLVNQRGPATFTKSTQRAVTWRRALLGCHRVAGSRFNAVTRIVGACCFCWLVNTSTWVSAQGTLAGALQLLREDRGAEQLVNRSMLRLAQEYGTPLYLYDRQSIVSQFHAVDSAFRDAFSHVRVFYALKANSNPAIVELLKSQGAGAEVVSGGEVVLARRCGVPASDIIFTSSSKSPDELDLAVREGVVVNVDSRDELEQLQQVAARLNRLVRMSIRVNPAVDPDTIHQINTGKTESKFGIHLSEGLALAAFARARELPNLQICGVHCHIGSQITVPESYRLAAEKMLNFVQQLQAELDVKLQFIDLGGGLGVPYHDGETVMTPVQLAAELRSVWQSGVKTLGYEPELWIEPGRYFVAPSGFLLVRVNSVKQTPVRTFVNVDAGFNTLARPAMYGAFHRVRVIGKSGNVESVDIAGNVCETGDLLATDRQLPLPAAGDLLVILDAGAYGFSMASQYNSRPLPAELLIEGDEVRVIRSRQTLDQLIPLPGD